MKTALSAKTWIWILFLLSTITGFVFGLSSCCTKKYCFGFDELNQISFQDFETVDLDSIVVLIFESTATGTDLLDSTMSDGSSGSISTSSSFKVDRRYKVMLLSTRQEYTLYGFETKRKSCNCKIIKPKSDYYDLLVSYFVNGHKQSEGYVYISR